MNKTILNILISIVIIATISLLFLGVYTSAGIDGVYWVSLLISAVVLFWAATEQAKGSDGDFYMILFAIFGYTGSVVLYIVLIVTLIKVFN